MNVKLRPAPTRVNAILGYPCVMVRNGYFIPIFFSVNKWNRFQDTSRLQKKLVWLSCGGCTRGVCSPRPKVYCGYFRLLNFGNSLTFSYIPPCVHAKLPISHVRLGPVVIARQYAAICRVAQDHSGESNNRKFITPYFTTVV